MSYKNSYIFLLIIIIFNINSLQSQELLTFQDAIKLLLENNYNIKLIKKSNEIVSNNLTAGNSGMLPSINANSGYNYQLTNSETDLFNGNKIIADNANNNNLNAGVELNWTLFDGFAMFKNYDKFKLQKSQSDIDIQITIENNIKQLSISYFNAVKLQQNINLFQKIIDLSNQKYELTKTKTSFGLNNSIDLLSSEVDINADSSNLIRAEIEFKNSIRNINLILGNKTNKDYNLDTNLSITYFDKVDNLLENAFENNSSINKAIKVREIAELDKELIATNYLPRLIFNSGYNYSRTTADQGFQLFNEANILKAGLQLQINLFDGNKTSLQSENAEINITIQDINIEYLKMQIETTIQNLYYNYQKNQELIILDQKGIKLSKLNYEKNLDLYNLGKINSLDARQTQLNYLRAMQKLNDSKFNLKLIETELLILIGKVLK